MKTKKEKIWLVRESKGFDSKKNYKGKTFNLIQHLIDDNKNFTYTFEYPKVYFKFRRQTQNTI